MTSRSLLVAGLAASLFACAQLIGSDFTGNSRPDDADGGDAASPDATGNASDAPGTPGADAPGPDTNAPPPPDGGGAGDAGTTIYCGEDPDASECVCATQASKGLVANAPCAATSVAAPSLCCTSAGWPNLQGMYYCVCSSIFCQTDVFGDVCQCGFAAPDVGEKPTTKCTGTVCCREKSTLAPTCACYTQNIPCPNGSEVVPSCSASDLMCDDLTVQKCR